ncbi:hypothetical protein [Priestia megaterium]|uniref:hypothetical protein n=1 Tax=Priestia megaterium TaxID=1404 RepID=UPI001642A12B|nr:hypothetical protein [Priestia megaterium]MCM3017119.1 hypothetical protein [Priestia megaterium]MED3913973.1 hypothetical protein [Priestia megaterium]
MTGGQGEDSCGKSGLDETPQEPSDEKAHGRPLKAKPCTGINSSVISERSVRSHLFVFKWK